MRGAARSRVAALCLIGSTSANATDVTLHGRAVQLSVTSTTSFAYHAKNDDSSSINDDYGEVFERLNLTATSGSWTLGSRLDTATFFSPPTPAIRSRYALEKAWAGWGNRSLELAIGDAYVSIGRGLALSLRKIDELGVDTSVRGAKLLVHEGDLAATLVAGVSNVQNVDEASGRSIDDPLDLIGGIQAQVTTGPLTTGYYATAVAFRDSLTLVPTDEYRNHYYQLGATLEAQRLSEAFAFYLEGLAQFRDGGAADASSSGVAVYGFATVYAGPLSLLLEGKAYGELEPIKPNLRESAFASVAYNNPPTVERVLQVLENPQQQVYGARLRADWTFSPALIMYGNYGLFLDELGYSDPEAIGRRSAALIHDPYGGLEVRWNRARSRALLSGGWRTVRLTPTGTVVRGDIHVEVDLALALTTFASVEIHGLHLERKKYESPVLDEQFREGTLSLGLRLRDYSVSGGYDYTTEPVQPKRDYFNGGAQWDITPSSSVRIFAGAARGGLKCISGVCRTFPPFEGVRVTATLRL